MASDFPSLSIIYESPKNETGVHRYSMTVIKALRFASVEFKEYPIRLLQFSIRNKPLGGWISQMIGAHLSGATGSIVHSTSPQVLTGKSNLVTIHDLIRYKYPNLYPSSHLDKRYAYGLLNKAFRCKRIATVSEHVKSDLVHLFGIAEEKIDTVYTFIDRNLYFPDERNPYPNDGKFHVVSVTDYNPRKKTPEVARSLAGHPEVDLYIIGRKDIWPAQYSMVEKIARDHKNIHILGFLPVDLLREYLSASNLYIAFSIDEGIGIPPVEAMACGTNVLANNIPVYHEFLDNMASYFENEEDLPDSVMDALKKPRKKDELVTFSSKYSIEATAEQMISCYSKIDRRFDQYIERLNGP